MRRYGTALILSILAFMIMPVMSVAAYITAPESITISNVTVFRSLAEADDYLALFHYSMPYASDNYSETPASSSIMFRLVDSSDAVAQTGAPYVYPFFNSNGYGDGVGSFYFSGNATGKPAWGEAAVIQIVGVSGFFSPAETRSYTLTTGDYVTATTQIANRDLAEQYILSECAVLETAYESESVTLKTTTDVGIILTGVGEAYFRGVIPGLQNLVPELFFIQTLVPTAIGVETYDMTGQAAFTTRLDGDDMGRGVQRVPALFGMSTNVGGFWSLIVFLVTVILSVVGHRRGWGAEVGLAAGTFVCIGVAILIGDAVYIIMMVGALVAAIGLIYITLLKRS